MKYLYQKRYGFIYVLSNTSMPGLFKVGRTKDVHKRIKQLDSTGVPTPFKLEYFIFVNDMFKIEKQVHFDLKPMRINGNREFFKVPIDLIIGTIHSSVELYYYEKVSSEYTQFINNEV